MERLTTSRKWEDAQNDLKNELGYSHIWKRLNAIENILGDDYDLDRLRELVTADNEGRYIIMKYADKEGVSRLVELAEADINGRVVVLPCKVGDSVYFITEIPGKMVKDAKVEEIYIGESGFALGVSTQLTTFTLQQSEVFFTKKAAEAALKGGQNG